MDVLTVNTIRLEAKAADKKDAIRQAGQLLVEAGYTAPSYVKGMLAREQMVSNYLGHGIAIPHGRREDLKDVYHSGISVIQLPQGVVWEQGEKAYLVFGLAAASDDLSVILTNIMEVLHNPKIIQNLVRTRDPMVIIERLTSGAVDSV